VLINYESCIGAFLLYNLITCILLLLLHIIYFLHLLSTNHKCTQPCYFPLLYKLAAQKVKIDWNSTMWSSRLCVAPVAIPVVLQSLSLFHFTRVVLVFKDIIYIINIHYL
jgi:hypothetical protein